MKIHNVYVRLKLHFGEMCPIRSSDGEHLLNLFCKFHDGMSILGTDSLIRMRECSAMVHYCLIAYGSQSLERISNLLLRSE